MYLDDSNPSCESAQAMEYLLYEFDIFQYYDERLAQNFSKMCVKNGCDCLGLTPYEAFFEHFFCSYCSLLQKCIGSSFVSLLYYFLFFGFW